MLALLISVGRHTRSGCGGQRAAGDGRPNRSEWPCLSRDRALAVVVATALMAGPACHKIARADRFHIMAGMPDWNMFRTESRLVTCPCGTQFSTMSRNGVWCPACREKRRLGKKLTYPPVGSRRAKADPPVPLS